MKILLNIEQLSLHGFIFNAAQASLLRSALQTELTQLLVNEQVITLGFDNSAMSTASAPAIRVDAGHNASRVGTDIAHAVHQATFHSDSLNGRKENATQVNTGRKTR